jgi:hypothetical protein
MVRELGELIKITTSTTVTLKDVISKEDRRLKTSQHLVKVMCGLFLMTYTVLKRIITDSCIRNLMVRRNGLVYMEEETH